LAFEKTKPYTHFKKLDYKKLDTINLIISSPYTKKCKQMQFALIDYFSQKGLLKE